MLFEYQPDGGATYVTADGDALDLIAFNFYGTHAKTTELTYEANRGLSLVPQPFAAGLTIKLPPPPEPVAPRTQIELWD